MVRSEDLGHSAGINSLRKSAGENGALKQKGCFERSPHLLSQDSGIQTNRKPADALADIRAAISELKAEEATLRQGFISGMLPLDGDEHTVTVTTNTIERIDLKTMRQHVAEAIWAPFVISKLTPYVRAWPKAKDNSR